MGWGAPAPFPGPASPFPDGAPDRYSTFEYSALTLGATRLAAAAEGDAISVTVTVRNRGEWAAGPSDEVVQVYAVPPAGLRGMSVPRQMLLGFAKVRLAPGEARRVELQLPASRLRLVGLDGRFGLLCGDWTLRVGEGLEAAPLQIYA